MMLSRWIPFLVAACVIAFGILRLRIAFRKDEPEDSKRPNYRKGGYYAGSKRSHMLFGILYLVLGACCVAMGFGYHIVVIKSCGGSESREGASPASDQGVPVDVAPASQ